MTREGKIASMKKAIIVERTRLDMLPGNREAVAALTEVLEFPDSLVRLYDLLTKGGNA